MKCSARSEAVVDDSWITVDTTSLHLFIYCTIPLICDIAKVYSTSCVIQHS